MKAGKKLSNTAATSKKVGQAADNAISVKPSSESALSDSMPSPWTRADKIFVAAVVAVFFVICLLNTIFHQMWADELQAWSIARDSGSLIDLLHNKRYETHPDLWYLILFVLSRFTREPWIMQAFNLLCATAAVFLFVRFSPFNRWIKALFALGYYPLFEYGAIVREYLPSMLLVFCLCALYPKRFRRYLTLSILLFLLAQTSVNGLILAGGFGLILIAEFVFNNKLRKMAGREHGIIGLALTLFFAGLAISVISMSKPADFDPSHAQFRSLADLDSASINSVGATPWRGCVPLPQLGDYGLPVHHFWNTNILQDSSWQIWLSLGLAVLVILSLGRSWPLLMFSSCWIAALALFVISKTEFQRHVSVFFISLVSALWIAARQYKPWLSGLFARFIQYAKPVFFVLLLLANAEAGMMASGISWRYPFVESKHAADFIRNNGYDKLTLTGVDDFWVLPVGVYLDKEIYFQQGNRFGPYVIWDAKHQNADRGKFWCDILAATGSISHIAVWHRPKEYPVEKNTPYDFENYTVTLLEKFDQAIEENGKCYIYLYQMKPFKK